MSVVPTKQRALTLRSQANIHRSHVKRTLNAERAEVLEDFADPATVERYERLADPDRILSRSKRRRAAFHLYRSDLARAELERLRTVGASS